MEYCEWSRVVVSNAILTTHNAMHGNETINDDGLASAMRWPNSNDQFSPQYIYEGIL